MASVDAKNIIKNIYPDVYGVHRVATFGDYRDRLKDLATFLGFTVIDEDV